MREIFTEYKNGWWHLIELDSLQQMIESLNERGARERDLKLFLQKNFNIVKSALSKVSKQILMQLFSTFQYR